MDLPTVMTPLGQRDSRDLQQHPWRGKARGFSLVELMVALVLGLVLLEGVLVLFSQTNRVNATQAAMSKLQESGRMALQSIADDLRQAGHMPCGSRVRPMVYADALAAHVSGAPRAADAPVGWPAATPYPLDRGVFIGGNSCIGETCTPAIVAGQGLPQAGLAMGDRVPGTDVLTLRYLQGNGSGVDMGDAAKGCDGKQDLGVITLHTSPNGAGSAAFDPAHLALLANCSAGEIFKPVVHGNELQPLHGQSGVPSCFATDAQTRVFDLDTQLQTAAYYLEMKARADKSGRSIPVLMRRSNGVTSGLVEGVERLDFRYSLIDAAGAARWLTAAQVDQARAGDGAPLVCGTSEADVTAPCSWSDINAVDVSMLVNTIEDLPPDESSHAWDYRYSVDGDAPKSPATAMPVTGLPAGRMHRREFHTVIALKNMAP